MAWGASERSQDEQGVPQTARGHLNDQDANSLRDNLSHQASRKKGKLEPESQLPGTQSVIHKIFLTR